MVVLNNDNELYINNKLIKKDILELIQLVNNEIFYIDNNIKLYAVSNNKKRYKNMCNNYEYKKIIFDLFSITCLTADGNLLVYNYDARDVISKNTKNVQDIEYNNVTYSVNALISGHYQPLYAEVRLEKHTTGIKVLDDNKIGLFSNSLNIITGSPNTGKSTLMINILKHISYIYPYRNSLYYSLEKDIESLPNDLKKDNIIIYNTNNLDVLEKTIEENKIDFVFIDYIQLSKNIDLHELNKIANKTNTMIVVIYELSNHNKIECLDDNLNKYWCSVVWYLSKSNNKFTLDYLYGEPDYKGRRYEISE